MKDWAVAIIAAACITVFVIWGSFVIILFGHDLCSGPISSSCRISMH